MLAIIHVLIGSATALLPYAENGSWSNLLSPLAVLGAIIGGANALKALVDPSFRQVREGDRGG